MDEFSEKDVIRIFIASTIMEAEAVERLLTEEGIDYAIAPEPYERVGLISIAQFNGLAFCVLTGQKNFCQRLLSSKGYTSGLAID